MYQIKAKMRPGHAGARLIARIVGYEWESATMVEYSLAKADPLFEVREIKSKSKQNTK